jgi:protein-S-isoprenylcysteine O-methyltransferase Ste14
MAENLPTDHRKSFSRTMVYITVVLSCLIGGGSMVVLVPFLYGFSFSVVDLELGLGATLAWDGLLCLAFFFQHSVMIRRWYRRQLKLVVSEPYHPALYAIASGTCLLALMLLWQPSSLVLVSLHGAFQWLARALFIVAFAGLWWGISALGGIDALGMRVLLAELRGRSEQPKPLAIRGPYRWVRHPLYTLMLLVIWSCPELSADRLLFNLSWTGWIILGTWLEERDLTADFGDDYRAYQRRVPMLIPWRRPTGHPNA